jgi:hypothetical protein
MRTSGIHRQHHRGWNGTQPDRGDGGGPNDLDWVPTNHWQAEDWRNFGRIRLRTVNVTHIAARTIDDFVQAVLETKSAFVMPFNRRRRAGS